MFVFIFRRDFRTYDNTAWNDCIIAASASKTRVLPLFIFSPSQIDPERNAYYSARCVKFMLESLTSLDKDLGGRKLICVESENDCDVLDQLGSRVSGVWFNRDVTPFARRRDTAIESWCKKKEIPCNIREDYTLHNMDTIFTKTGSYYQVYTPFYRACRKVPVRGPEGAPRGTGPVVAAKPPKGLKYFSTGSAQFEAYAHDAGDIKGGRPAALAILERAQTGAFQNYEEDRNDMAAEKTTRLSAYLKFGCISIREAFAALSRIESLIGELYWREFYFHLTWNRPDLLKGHAFRVKWENVAWKPASRAPAGQWNAWKEGRTGYPLVDAGMRQMQETGFMHNRSRMVVAMFLIKHLHIDWRDGERFFACSLIDYDPCQNNGGWQWCASSGVDTQPYRIFNPWLQTARYDQTCEYIKRWVPELRDVPYSDILKWDRAKIRAKYPGKYAEPIVEHEAAVKEALVLMKTGTRT